MTRTRRPIPGGVILVIRTSDPDEALAAAEGAIVAGIDAVEITMTVPQTPRIIADLAGRGTPIGVGTVLRAADIGDAVAAGATFVVAPNTDRTVLRAAHAQGVAMVSGALTPTEVQRAYSEGADAVKLFPAGALGGPHYLAELQGPLPHVPFVISGGVTVDSAREYLTAGALAVCVGLRMIEPKALASRDIDTIADSAARYLAAVRQLAPTA